VHVTQQSLLDFFIDAISLELIYDYEIFYMIDGYVIICTVLA